MINIKPYIFKLRRDYNQSLFGLVDNKYVFENKWMKIYNGNITIKKGYSWDGCSHKVSFFDLIVIGTPDGIKKEGYPKTYFASLVHDVLCQFRIEHDISREITNKIFYKILKDWSFAPAKIYYLAVKIFAPRNFKGSI